MIILRFYSFCNCTRNQTPRLCNAGFNVQATEPVHHKVKSEIAQSRMDANYDCGTGNSGSGVLTQNKRKEKEKSKKTRKKDTVEAEVMHNNPEFRSLTFEY